jgi:predicted secreted protein with PEFG-CTERM motif
MLKIVFFVMLSLMLMIPGTVFAAEESGTGQNITLTTDNTAYTEGDIITISGKVDKIIVGLEVSLQVFFEKNQIGISQIKVSQDGAFTDTITVGGPLWKNEGTITIKATYGDISTENSIEFFKDTAGEYLSIYEVKIPDAGTFDTYYTIKGATVTSMSLNQKNLSLLINIDTKSDGTLDIKLLRDNIDALSNDRQDIDFIVLVYENDSKIPIQTEFKKIKKDDGHREISIPIRNGDDKIEIIGTHVVPEFGTIAMIVLAVAIVSIIAVSAKSRLSIMPRI